MTKDRIAQISAMLKQDEAALVTSEPGRLYLTGFPSSAGAVLVTAEKAFFLIDFRYYEKAKETVHDCEVIRQDAFFRQLHELFAAHGIKRLYVETARLDVASFLGWRERFSELEVSDSPCLDEKMDGLRAVKTPEEIALMEQAQEMTDKTFSYILGRITPGRTEREIALDMEFYLRNLGSEGVSFDFIVVSGKNSSLPHGVPTGKAVERGDFVTMDFGAVVSGYRSDMTRTVAIGSVTAEQKKVYETVLNAQETALRFLHAGVHGCDTDKVARDVIAAAGYGECFGHSLGHSVGIEIHESPTCAAACMKELPAGTIMTVEPGIYLAGKFGVRIEDMVVVTPDGCRDLTASPKNLIIL